MNICVGWPAVLSATAEQWTAAGTWALAAGVIFAGLSFFWQRRANRVLEAGNLVREWSAPALRKLRRDIDESPDKEDNRRKANSLLETDVTLSIDGFIEDTARLTERIEAYIRNGLADERIIAELLVYDVVALYYACQDALKQRANEDNLNYEGWRDLALRLRDLSRIYPKSIDLVSDLKWDFDIPPLEYRTPGDVSAGYVVPFLRRPMLAWCNSKRPKPASVPASEAVEPPDEG